MSAIEKLTARLRQSPIRYVRVGTTSCGTRPNDQAVLEGMLHLQTIGPFDGRVVDAPWAWDSTAIACPHLGYGQACGLARDVARHLGAVCVPRLREGIVLGSDALAVLDALEAFPDAPVHAGVAYMDAEGSPVAEPPVGSIGWAVDIDSAEAARRLGAHTCFVIDQQNTLLPHAALDAIHRWAAPNAVQLWPSDVTIVESYVEDDGSCSLLGEPRMPE